MNRLTKAVVRIVLSSAALAVPAAAEYCGPQAATFEVGNRSIVFGGPGGSTPTTAIIVQSLPIGSNSIIVALNPVETGMNVVYNGPVQAGQRINFPGYAGTFYVKVPGSGGQAALLICHN